MADPTYVKAYVGAKRPAKKPAKPSGGKKTVKVVKTGKAVPSKPYKTSY